MLPALPPPSVELLVPPSTPVEPLVLPPPPVELLVPPQAIIIEIEDENVSIGVVVFVVIVV